MNYVEYKFVGDDLPDQIYDPGMNFRRPSFAPLIFLDTGFQELQLNCGLQEATWHAVVLEELRYAENHV